MLNFKQKSAKQTKVSGVRKAENATRGAEFRLAQKNRRLQQITSNAKIGLKKLAKLPKIQIFKTINRLVSTGCEIVKY